MISEGALGGIIFFKRNVESAGQVAEVIAEAKSLSLPGLEPVFCVDQEGGRVQRLTGDGFTRLPPLGVLGQMSRSDPQKALDMTYRHGRVMATEMLACGIDLSFAPVLDLNKGSCVIGDRSLSDDPDEVIRLGRAYLAGMHDSGMKTTGKHFPGHGSIIADSHVDDVSDSRTLQDIVKSDLRPFQELAPVLDSLMIAHVVYPQVDSLPAGYSKRWLKDILKNQMGYQGVVLSDDLGMYAAKSVGGLEERARLSLKAGCDLALVCQPEEVAEILGALDDSLSFDEPAAPRLFGNPTVSKQELESVDREGVKEWSRWRLSLEALEGQNWS